MTDDAQKKKLSGRRGRKPDRRRELFLRIAADIDSGKLTGKLPGVMKLAGLYNTCHGTVQNAIRMLAEEGYIEVLPRSGSYVRRRLEVVMAGLYIESRKPLNIPDAYTNFMANLGPLYQGLHDTLNEAGVPLTFEVIDVGNSDALRRLKRPRRHLVINFPIMQPEKYYSLFDGCSWTRVFGAFDRHCPSAHFTCDNPAIGRLAAKRLIEKGCRRFAGIGSHAIELFRQRFESFSAELNARDYRAEHLEIDSFQMNLPEILNCMKAFFERNAEALRTGELGIFCAADAFMQPLQQVLENLPGQDRAAIVSCDGNPYFLQNVSLRADEIDIGLREIGIEIGKHILTEPDVPIKRVFPPVLHKR